MKAADLCTKTADLVGGDREDSHGSKERNHENIARLWQAYLESRHDPVAPLEALDVLHMMVLLKVARTQLGSFNLDDYVDMIGYSACGGEVASIEDVVVPIDPALAIHPLVPRRNDDGT